MILLTEDNSGQVLTSVLNKQVSTDPKSIAKAQRDEFISKSAFDQNNINNISVLYDDKSHTCQITGNVKTNHLVYIDAQPGEHENLENTGEDVYEINLLFKDVAFPVLSSDNENEAEGEESEDRLQRPTINKETPLAQIDIDSKRCLVRCTCQHYRFYYSEANKQQNFVFGGSFPTYESKGVGQKKNPNHNIGMCKHIIFFITQLLNKEIPCDGLRVKLISNKWDSILPKVDGIDLTQPHYKSKYKKKEVDQNTVELNLANSKISKYMRSISDIRINDTEDRHFSRLRKAKQKLDNLFNNKYVRDHASDTRIETDKKSSNYNKELSVLHINGLLEKYKNIGLIQDSDVNSITTLSQLRDLIDKKSKEEPYEYLKKKAEKLFADCSEQDKQRKINEYINNHKIYLKNGDYVYDTGRNARRLAKGQKSDLETLSPGDLSGYIDASREDKYNDGLKRHRFIRKLASDKYKSWRDDQLKNLDVGSKEYKAKTQELKHLYHSKMKEFYNEFQDELLRRAKQRYKIDNVKSKDINKLLNAYIAQRVGKKTSVNKENKPKSDETKTDKNNKQTKKNSDVSSDTIEEPEDNDNLELSSEDIDKKYNELTQKKKQIDTEFQKRANAYHRDSNEENKQAFEDIRQQKNDLQAEYKKIEKQYKELHKDDNNQLDSDEQKLDDKLKGKNDYEKLEFMSSERRRLEQEFIKYESLINTSKSETVVAQSKISQNEVQNQLTLLNRRYERLNGIGFIKNNYFSKLKAEAAGYSATKEEEKIESKKANILAEWQPLNKRRIELVAIGKNRELTNKEEKEYNDIVDKVSSYEQEYKKLTGTLIKGGYYWNKQVEKNKKPKKTTVSRAAKNSENNTPKKKATAKKSDSEVKSPTITALPNVYWKTDVKFNTETNEPIEPKEPDVTTSKNIKKDALKYVQSLVDIWSWRETELHKLKAGSKEYKDLEAKNKKLDERIGQIIDDFDLDGGSIVYHN